MEFIRDDKVIHTIVAELGDKVINVPAFKEPTKVRVTFGDGTVTEAGP